MNRWFSIPRLLCAVFILSAALGCGGEMPIIDPGDQPGDDAGSPSPDYTPDPEIFSKPANPAQIIEQTNADGSTVEYPVNQMIVLLNEGAPAGVAHEVAASVGGTVVGQVPAIGMFQIELTTVSEEALEGAIDSVRANPFVADAGYNALAELNQTCPAPSDNYDILPMDQCPFAEMEYYQALTMFDIFRPHLRLHDVTVGVVDSGIDLTTGEFSEVDFRYLNSLTAPPDDPHPLLHGTAVSGVIAANDDYNGVNGIALRFLQDDLHLVVGKMTTVAGGITYAFHAVNAGARIVNLSIGYENTHSRFSALREAWRRAMSYHPQVLFVCAAGNETLSLTGSNYAPGGMNMPNSITVASTANCNPTALASWSNFGPAVDVAASGDEMPVVGSGGMYIPTDGTSFAAPAVVSLAAILKSLNPSLTPGQLRDYITDNAMPINDGVSFGRVNFPNTIGQLLIDMNVADPVGSWLDPDDDGTFGSSGMVLSRICPSGMLFSVEGYDTYDLHEPEHTVGLGLIGTPDNPPTLSVGGGDGNGTMLITASDDQPFKLGTYALTMDGGPGTAVVRFDDLVELDFGGAVSGSLVIDSCRIDERDPFDGIDPWIVTVSGVFEGSLKMSHLDGRDPTLHAFNGHFTWPCLFALADSETELTEYLEAECEGGIPRDGTSGSSP